MTKKNFYKKKSSCVIINNILIIVSSILSFNKEPYGFMILADKDKRFLWDAG